MSDLLEKCKEIAEKHWSEAEATHGQLLSRPVPKFSVEDLRVLYCMDYIEFQEVFGFGEAGDYAKGKFRKCGDDLFAFLADLDNGNQRKLYDYMNKG